MDTTTTVLDRSPTITVREATPAHHSAPPRQTPRIAPVTPVPPVFAPTNKGRRLVLIAGIVLGHLVTIFGPLLLSRWLVG